MPTVLQINATSNWGSTGRIAEQINEEARKHGWNTYYAYGRYFNPSMSNVIKVGNRLNVYEHYIECRLFDNDGLASRFATKSLTRKISDIKPDIIHLHNIHDHWLNYRILFEYFSTIETPIVWTQHDCWSYTGGCPHYTRLGCYRWKDDSCGDGCPLKSRLACVFGEKTLKHYQLKKTLFTSIMNLTLVPVSNWMSGQLKNSFFKDKNIRTIHNGVDIHQFNPENRIEVRKKYGIGDYKYLIAVSGVWLPYKGWNDYIELSKRLPNDIKIVLVGLDEEKKRQAESFGIIGVPRVNDVNDLAALYTSAEIVLNLSREESFGLTTVEGLACGTPSIVYNCTASPELVTPETGVVVEPDSFEEVLAAIESIFSKGKTYFGENCRKRAVDCFDKGKCYEKYLALYDELLH